MSERARTHTKKHNRDLKLESAGPVAARAIIIIIIIRYVYFSIERENFLFIIESIIIITST